MTKKQAAEMLKLLQDIKVSLQAYQNWYVPQNWFTTLPLIDLKTNVWSFPTAAPKSEIK